MTTDETIDLDAIGEAAPTNEERAEEAVDEVEEEEADELTHDLDTIHPHGVDERDGSAEFRSLMEKIDATEDEQERAKHYRDALDIFTNNWLGRQ